MSDTADGESAVPLNPFGDRHGFQRPGTTYRIRISGHLGDEWSRWVRDMTIARGEAIETGQTTEIVVSLLDEAALMGLLDRFYTRGARLLSLERLEEAAP